MVKFEKYTIPAASMGQDNPMPDIKNVGKIHATFKLTDKIREDEKTYIGEGKINTILPYSMQDGYDRNKQMRDFKAAVLENDYIKAVFLPELGGRLWSLYDKKLRRELLYVNPVFQPGNLALRNAWFSGGVEFNVGVKGHNPLTCSPMWCAVDKTEKGEILRLYEYERIRGVVYSINAFLPEDSSVLYLKCKIENTAAEQKHMYWWSNIAVPETKKTRVLVPAEESFLTFYDEDHYLVDKASIPVHENVDISYPKNLPASRDFFYKIPKKTHKWIAAVEEDGIGLLQCSTPRLLGRKLFVWGQGQGGRHWGEWLSVEGSSYVEIQAGLAHLQLEHIPMPGNTTWEWVEGYTALQASPDVLHGDYANAVDAVEEFLAKKAGDVDALPFPSDDEIISSEIIYKGSDWGALEEKLRGSTISKLCRFEKEEGGESDAWWKLLSENKFPCPDVSDEPKSYVAGAVWLEKLKALSEQNWYSLLQMGVIEYAEGNHEAAEQAWKLSLEAEKSPWALRNLAMLYANEYNKLEQALKCIVEAFEMLPDCISLVCDTANLLTRAGKHEQWLEMYDTLSDELKAAGRLRLYKGMSLIELDRLEEAMEIVNADFVMNDLKEGELSISYLWFKLYRKLYARENGIAYNAEDEQLRQAADAKYPLPRSLDFRMHD